MIANKLQIGCLVSLAVAGCSRERARSSHQSMAETVQKDVESLVRALYSGDFATVLDHTHPVILEGIGGRERALSMMNQSMSSMLEKGLRIESFTFPRPPEF